MRLFHTLKHSVVPLAFTFIMACGEEDNPITPTPVTPAPNDTATVVDPPAQEPPNVSLEDGHEWFNAKLVLDDIHSSRSLKAFTIGEDVIVEEDGTFNVQLENNTVNLIELYDNKDSLIAYSIHAPQNNKDSILIGAKSIALSFVYMSPEIDPPAAEDFEAFVQLAETLPSFPTLLEYFEDKTKDPNFIFDFKDEALISSLANIHMDIYELSQVNNGRLSSDGEKKYEYQIKPSALQSGIEVIDPTIEDSFFSFKLKNRGKRYVDLYGSLNQRDGAIQDLGYLGNMSGFSNDLLLNQTFQTWPEGDPQRVSMEGIRKYNIEAWGLGLKGEVPTDFEDQIKLTEASVVTIAEEYMNPIMTLILGKRTWDSGKKPVDSPSKNPAKILMLKCHDANDFNNLLRGNKLLLQALNERSLTDFAYNYAYSLFKCALGKPELLADYLADGIEANREKILAKLTNNQFTRANPLRLALLYIDVAKATYDLTQTIGTTLLAAPETNFEIYFDEVLPPQDTVTNPDNPTDPTTPIDLPDNPVSTQDCPVLQSSGYVGNPKYTFSKEDDPGPFIFVDYPATWKGDDHQIQATKKVHKIKGGGSGGKEDSPWITVNLEGSEHNTGNLHRVFPEYNYCQPESYHDIEFRFSSSVDKYSKPLIKNADLAGSTFFIKEQPPLAEIPDSPEHYFVVGGSFKTCIFNPNSVGSGKSCNSSNTFKGISGTIQFGTPESIMYEGIQYQRIKVIFSVVGQYTDFKPIDNWSNEYHTDNITIKGEFYIAAP
ncbi:MAG: hypothetical protein RIG62_03530 [Cyclobacteriaceae bacterium]